MTRMLIIGPPGAGKGTQAARICERLGVPAISTGDIFRANIKEQTELGKEAQRYTDAGNLVPDSVTNNMVRDRLSHDDVRDGFLLDGFPRTVEQAGILGEILSDKDTALDGVLNYQVSEDVVVERMLARGRSDDTEETIRTRLQVYRDETAPLIDFYSDIIVNVDAEGTVEDISCSTLDALDR
mgnify:CR=1 FL=1